MPVEAKARKAVRVEALERAGWMCQAASFHGLGPCEGELHVHELQARSARPGGHLDADNCVVICARHHMVCHRNPELARALGLIVPSWEKPMELLDVDPEHGPHVGVYTEELVHHVNDLIRAVEIHLTSPEAGSKQDAVVKFVAVQWDRMLYLDPGTVHSLIVKASPHDFGDLDPRDTVNAEADPF